MKTFLNGKRCSVSLGSGAYSSSWYFLFGNQMLHKAVRALDDIIKSLYSRSPHPKINIYSLISGRPRKEPIDSLRVIYHPQGVAGLVVRCRCYSCAH